MMKNLDFTLTTNELLAVLRILRVKTILGLPVDPYAKMSPDEEINALSDGLHRFFHMRGLYEAFMDPHNPRHETALGMLSALCICAFCTTSLVVNHRSATGEELWMAWHRKLKFDPLIVQYKQSHNNRHTFGASAHLDTLYSSLGEFLPKMEMTTKSKAIRMSIADWEALRSESPYSKNTAVDRFPFVKTMLKEANHLWLNIVDYNDKIFNRTSNGLSFLYSHRGLWLFEETPGVIYLIPCTTASLNEKVNGLVATFTADQ